MWFCGMDDLGSTMKEIGTDTDSGIKLKSNLGSTIRVGLRVWSKSKKIKFHIHFPTMECDYPK